MAKKTDTIRLKSIAAIVCLSLVILLGACEATCPCSKTKSQLDASTTSTTNQKKMALNTTPGHKHQNPTTNGETQQ